MIRSSFVLSAAALACALSSSVLAQGAANNPHLRMTQHRHWTFSEIGDVGNAPHDNNVGPFPVPGGPPPLMGSVDYRYRISTTEVTWGQYYEFVQAYAPSMPSNFWSGIGGANTLTPSGVIGLSPIVFQGSSNGVPQYTLDPAFTNRPATSSWRLFARMVNWLHNGAPSAAEAVASDFENGAYDTSTFDRVQGPSGIFYFTDQDSRSEGARFWIPSLDELTKAAFYDPNRHGEGQGGYWEYPTSSDTAPIAGDPALGGETNAGSEDPRFDDWPEGQFRPLDVGTYPETQSPWGLLDTFGGGLELTETWTRDDPERHSTRFLGLTSSLYSPLSQGELGDLGFSSPNSWFSLRLAMAVPAPGACSLLAFSALLAARRRR
jgi:formylglycine-generating enzyme required for sulfatase activity